MLSQIFCLFSRDDFDFWAIIWDHSFSKASRLLFFSCEEHWFSLSRCVDSSVTKPCDKVRVCPIYLGWLYHICLSHKSGIDIPVIFWNVLVWLIKYMWTYIYCNIQMSNCDRLIMSLYEMFLTMQNVMQVRWIYTFIFIFFPLCFRVLMNFLRVYYYVTPHGKQSILLSLKTLWNLKWNLSSTANHGQRYYDKTNGLTTDWCWRM